MGPSPDLKPCPFCGDAASVREHFLGPDVDENPHGFVVYCVAELTCAVEMWGPNEDEAIAKWNRRSP